MVTTSPGLARTTCSLRKSPSPVAPSKHTTIPKCAIHMPNTSVGKRCQRDANPMRCRGFSCVQMSVAMPIASHAISITTPIAPMAISCTKATPMIPAMIAETLAASKVVLARGVAPRRHAITGPITIITTNMPMTGLKVASKYGGPTVMRAPVIISRPSG